MGAASPAAARTGPSTVPSGRARRTHGTDLPKRLRIYAFGAALGGTAVLDEARTLAEQSGIPSGQLVLVDRHDTYSHNDPSAASPANAFLQNLTPFLREIGG